jgi:hypothetical protein
VVPPPVVPPVVPPPEVPAGVAPPELGLALEEPAAALDELDALLAPALGTVAVVAVVGVVDVVVLGVEVAARLELGTVIAGASTVSAAGVPPALPHPATAALATSTTRPAANRFRAVGPLTISDRIRRRAAPSGGRSAGSR